MDTTYDGMTLEQLIARTQLTLQRRRDFQNIRNGNPHEEFERRAWHHLREQQIRRGRNPLHPAFRLYPTWEAFYAAGKPWHSHGEPGERHMSAGDEARRWEDDQFRSFPRQRMVPQHREDKGLQPTPQNPSVAYGGIPAGVLMQMMADANGGLGADWITPGSPERQVQAYMDSVRNNGIKIPGNLRLA